MDTFSDIIRKEKISGGVAGLNGYEDVIREMARLTDDWVQLSEDKKWELNEKLQELILEKGRPDKKILYV